MASITSKICPDDQFLNIRLLYSKNIEGPTLCSREGEGHEMTKSEALLLLYITFEENHAVIKNDYLSLTGVSDPTFRRYISDLRCFLAEWRPYEEIVYRKGDGVYYLRDID
jgi:hypothetical protein